MPISRTVLTFGAGLLLGTCSIAACSTSSDEASTNVTDAGAAQDVEASSDAAASAVDASDGAPPPVCTEDRRRCVGMDLQVCENGAWKLLQSCLPGEWCDVAVGICRPVDAGTDAN